MKIPGTVPLTQEVLTAMAEEEQNFWYGLHDLVTAEIEKNKEAMSQYPYAPSEKLRELLLVAKDKYDGTKYCHVQQILGAFKF